MSYYNKKKKEDLPVGYGQFYMPVFYELTRPASKIVYITLAQMRAYETIELTDSRLAFLSKLNDKTVRSAVAELKDKGFISVTDGENVRSSKEYRLLDADLAATSDVPSWCSKWLRAKAPARKIDKKGQADKSNEGDANEA